MKNATGSGKMITTQSGKYIFCFLALIFCIGTAVYSFAEGEKPVSLNEAVDDGDVRIVQSKSTGGYSRFMIEMENLSDKPLSVDPYGSAFDPPSGVGTQRVGIGLPIRIGDQQMNMRNRLSTDPSQEAPVGAAAAQDSSNTIPNKALPAAAGAAAGVVTIGTLLTGMAQGVKPREALSDLAGLIRGGADTVPEDLQAVSDFDYQTGIIKSYRDQDMSELDYQKQRLEAAKTQGAQDVVSDAEAAVKRLSGQIDSYDKNLTELGQRPLEHTEMEKRSFDYTRKDLAKEVRADLADQALGTLSGTDRIGIDLWITDHAPTQQAYEDMQGLVDNMVVKTKDGTLIGDKHSILGSLGKELQRTNKPYLTYFEQKAMDPPEEKDLMDTLKDAKDEYNDLDETVKTIFPKSKNIEDAENRLKGWENDGRSPGGAAAGTIGKATKIIDAGSTIYNDTKKNIAAGNSRTLAVAKAAKKYVVDLAVNTLMEQNPAMKVVNTLLKYSEPVIGKDVSPAKGWQILTDKALDSFTGEYDHKEVDKLDFNSAEVKDVVKDGQVKGLEERLNSSRLTDGERQEITTRLRELKKT